MGRHRHLRGKKIMTQAPKGASCLAAPEPAVAHHIQARNPSRTQGTIQTGGTGTRKARRTISGLEGIAILMTGIQRPDKDIMMKEDITEKALESKWHQHTSKMIVQLHARRRT